MSTPQHESDALERQLVGATMLASQGRDALNVASDALEDTSEALKKFGQELHAALLTLERLKNEVRQATSKLREAIKTSEALGVPRSSVPPKS